MAQFNNLLVTLPKSEDPSKQAQSQLAFAVQILKAQRNNVQIETQLKSVFARMTALKEVKNLLVAIESGKLSLPCNLTIRALQVLICNNQGSLVPLTSHEFYQHFLVRVLITTNS